MIRNRRVAALIPIKDHSERVSGKNFRPFCGRPLYHHVLLTLDKTYAVDEIVIDTDSPRVIAEAPRLSRKVRVIERPPELCGDFVSTNLLFAHDIAQIKADIYIQTHATNPLLKAETVADALRTFIEMGDLCDSLCSVNAHQSRFYTAAGCPVNHDPAKLLRTQDLPALYEENSCLYIFTAESFAASQARIGRRPHFYTTPAVESVDIDDEISWRIAEMLGFHSLARAAA